MRGILATLEPNEDPCEHKEFRSKVHSVCKRFLGGDWKLSKTEDLSLERIKGATSNMLFICRLPSVPSNGTPNCVLLRVYFNPDKENSLLSDTVVFTLLSERKLGPQLLGVFDEGRLEEYIPSRPLATREIAIPRVSDEIARRLARIHQLNVPVRKEPDYLDSALDRWFKQLQKAVPLDYKFKMPEKSLGPRSLTLTDLNREITQLRSLMSRSKSKVVFCHNDLQEGNILLPNTVTENDSLSLVFIDFEYASYNYRGFDFANHFIEYSICYDVDESPYFSVRREDFPQQDTMIRFFSTYLNELDPKLNGSALRSEAERMIVEALSFIPVSHLFWSIWSLLQAETSPLSFGFQEYAQERLAAYFETKSLLQEFIC